MIELSFNPIKNIKILHIYEYYDEPITYSFYNDVGSLFLANLVDWDEEKSANIWLYIQVELNEIIKLENKELTLREITMDAMDKHSYIGIETDTKEDFFLLEPQSIDANYIPDEGSYIVFENEKKLLSVAKNMSETLIKNNRYVLEISFEPEGKHDHEIDSRFLGNALIDTQNIISSLALPSTSNILSRYPEEIKKATQMKVTDTFAASFGIRLESNVHANILSDDIVSKSLQKFHLLFDNLSKDEPNMNKEFYSDFNAKSMQKFNDLVEEMSEKNISGKIKIGTPLPGANTNIKESTFTVKNLKDFSILAEKNVSEKTENITVNGVLYMHDHKSKMFKIFSDSKEDELVIKGMVNDNLSDSVFIIPSNGSAKIKKTTTINNVTKKGKVTYVLLEFIET